VDREFVDRYEILQLSPNASAETIERVYRLLAKRYHPDNQDTGDADKFSAVLEAYQTLSDPVRRAAYDAAYDEQHGVQWKIFDQGSAGSDREQDRRISHGILSLLYVARRRDPRRGGLGAVHLERLLGCPQEHLEFPLWYLKQRGAIETLDTGQFAITVDGIDQLGTMDGSNASMRERLLPASSLSA
jgi:curved DNA-binding protein CbpA